MPVSSRRVAARYLSAASARLDPKVKTTTNAALIKAGMDGNGRFRSPGMALARISEVLATHGIEWGEVIQSFPLRQPQGRMVIDLALTNPEDSFSPTDIANSALAFQWYQLGDEQYEIVAYLS
jgi:hypothetical protein